MSLNFFLTRTNPDAQLRKAVMETDALTYKNRLRSRSFEERNDPLCDNGEHLLEGLRDYTPHKVAARIFTQGLDTSSLDKNDPIMFDLHAHCLMAANCMQVAVKETNDDNQKTSLKQHLLQGLTHLYIDPPSNIMGLRKSVSLGLEATSYILGNTDFAEELNGADWACAITEAAKASTNLPHPRNMLPTTLDIFAEHVDKNSQIISNHQGLLIDGLRSALSAAVQLDQKETAHHAIHLIGRIAQQGQMAPSLAYIDKDTKDSFNTIAARSDETLNMLLKHQGSRYLSDENKQTLIKNIISGGVGRALISTSEQDYPYSAALNTLLDQQPKSFTPDHVRMAVDHDMWGCAEQIAFRAPCLTPAVSYGLMMDILIQPTLPEDTKPVETLLTTLIGRGVDMAEHGKTLLDIARHRKLDACAEAIAKKIETPSVIRRTLRPQIAVV